MTLLPFPALLLSLLAFLFIPPGTNSQTIVDLSAHSSVSALDSALAPSANDGPVVDLWVLIFYAPWCGHCKALLPVLELVAEDTEGVMNIGKVDCTQKSAKAICKHMEVKGYPTLKVYRHGDGFSEFQGPRTFEGMQQLAMRLSRSPLTTASSLSSVLSAVHPSSDGVAFVGYDPSRSGTKLDEVIRSTDLLRAFTGAARTEQAVSDSFLLDTDDPAAIAEVLGRAHDGATPFVAKVEAGEPAIVYDGELSADAIHEFLVANNVARVTEIGPHNFRHVVAIGRPLAILVTNEEESASVEKLEEMQAASRTRKDLANAFTFCRMNGKKWKSFLTQFGMNDDTVFPEVFVLDSKKKIYYRNVDGEHPVTAEGFLTAVFEKKVESKKQERPVRPGANPLTEMKEVFVKFYPYSLAIFIPISLILGVIVMGFFGGFDQEEEELEVAGAKKEGLDTKESKKEK
mmetsp:Transcript_40208/g.78582  ORF Transcript_40208/g.78582 Transcript_40208/m.78582 type:complete len:458 (-) Transcript_40208:97-1470(-)